MMDNLNISYRQFHETFMQNHTGTSVEETIVVQTSIPFITFFSVCVVSWVERHAQFFSILNIHILKFFIEFLFIVVIQILIFTLFEYAGYLYSCIYIFAFYLLIMILLRYKNEATKQKHSWNSLKNFQFTGRRAYITCFRASVNLTTTICILAVDFTSFPRAMAKTETFGFSLMDTGVGYFVVCNALVGRHNYNDEDNLKEKHFGFVQLKRNVPLLVLGLLRTYSTRNMDYQNHSTEYGVHWNFFLTLAVVRLSSAVLLRYIHRDFTKYIAVIIVTCHQLILHSGVQDWVLSDAPRGDLFSANREGIVSLMGYIGLYVVSVELKNRLLKKVSTFEKDIHLLIRLFLSAIILYAIVVLLNYYIPCSRRLANVTYIAWIVMLSLYLLMFSLLLELILVILNFNKKKKHHTKLVPTILESINYNALLYFLGANLLTGIINLSIETLYVSHGYSICILILYMFTPCSIVTYLYYKNCKII